MLSISSYSLVDKPLNIFRTSKKRIVNYEAYTECYHKWLILNPNVKMYWYTDRDVDKYMKTQSMRIYNAYRIIKPGAYKIDLFRLCILYQYGGLYIDDQATPYVPIKEMLKHTNSDFVSVLDSKNALEGIHNGFIYCKNKGHPFLKKAIEDVVTNIINKSYEDHALAITGPIALRRSINRCLNRDSETRFQAGLNNFGSPEKNVFLFQFVFGPNQNIYKKNRKILSKKYNFLIWVFDLLNRSKYTNMYRMKTVFD